MIYQFISNSGDTYKPILSHDYNTGNNLHAPLTSPTQNVLKIQQNLTDDVKINVFCVILYEFPGSKK